VAKTKALAVLEKGGLPAELMDAFAPFINEQAEALKTTSTGISKLSAKGGTFRIGDRDFGRQIEVVVLGAVFLNTFFDAAFVEGEVKTPDCFAIGLDDKGLIPDPTAPKIQGWKQRDAAPPEGEKRACTTCWANAFGTAERSPTGRGKACQNRFRLALLHPDELKALAEGKVLNPVLFEIPPSSRIGWAKFSTAVVDGRACGMKLPLFGPVIQLSIKAKGGAWEIEPSLVTNGDGKPTLTFNSREMALKLAEVATAAKVELLRPYASVGAPSEGGPTRRKSSGADRKFVPVKHKARKTA